jgi:AraC-like DNA-binding protein
MADAVHQYLEDCFVRGDVARTSELAQQLGMSTVQLTRVCRQVLSAPPCRYFRRLQIQRACELLVTTDWTVEQISAHAGFGTQSTFFRVFQHYEHCTPTDFRLMRRRIEKNTTTHADAADLRS